MKPEPNTNLIVPCKRLSLLRVQLAPGRKVLRCAVYAPHEAIVWTVYQMPQALMQELKDVEEKYI